MIFDTHAHYDSERFQTDREAVLKGLKLKNVGAVVNIGTDLKTSRYSIELCKQYDFMYTTIGVHPHEVKDMRDDDLEHLIMMSGFPQVVGIGEIGLDYYYDFSPRAAQRLWFRSQLELAKQLELPVSIHTRDAAQETFDILLESEIGKIAGGVIHAYSGSAEMAEDYVKAGFYLGIGGVLTFKNGRKLVEVVERIPIEHLVLETDAPYMTPEPHRGKRNDSSMISYVVDKIAEIKGLTAVQVENITWDNACRLWKLEI
ncbi:TatD family deoxyribonuclease [Clostridiales bacterium COT073_COT-073]|nr:TatD family deoxyribonuclease [Clostridiales bacterium COT073_COT-073]